MKYILVEIPNEVSDDTLDEWSRVIRQILNHDEAALSTWQERKPFEITVKFGSLFTSL